MCHRAIQSASEREERDCAAVRGICATVPGVLHTVSCSCCGPWALFCSSTELASSQGDSSAWRWAAIFNTNLLMAVKANKQRFVFIYVSACVCFHLCVSMCFFSFKQLLDTYKVSFLKYSNPGRKQVVIKHFLHSR